MFHGAWFPMGLRLPYHSQRHIHSRRRGGRNQLVSPPSRVGLVMVSSCLIWGTLGSGAVTEAGLVGISGPLGNGGLPDVGVYHWPRCWAGGATARPRSLPMAWSSCPGNPRACGPSVAALRIRQGLVR